jgi:hypothetical protein
LRIADWFQTLTPKQKTRLPYLVLVLAVFAAYADVYHNAFVWDDVSLVVSNGSLRHWGGLIDIFTKTTLGPYYRPLQALVYFFIYQLFGLSQPAFHGANILIHALNVCLVFRLGCRLGFYRSASFTAALLWGVHPLWIEIVAVVAGTADLLVVTFLLTGLLALLPKFKPRHFRLAVLFFILAIGSKEHAVVFPALVTFTLFLASKERLKPAVYLKTWPLWLLAAAYIIGFLMCPVLNNLPSYVDQNAIYVQLYENNVVNRILTALATLPVYLGLILTPANLHLAWNFPIYTIVGDWHVIAGVAMVAATLLQIFHGRGKRGLPLSWGLLWFATALSPYTGILKPVDGQFFEHWIYLPTIGLFLGVSQTVAVWMNTLRPEKYFKKVSIIAVGLVTLATVTLGIKTYLQNEILHDRGSMFESIIKYNPDLVWARDNLAMFYFEQKEYQKAAEQWRVMETLDYMRYINKDHALFIHNALAFIDLNILSEKNKDDPSIAETIRSLPTCARLPEAIEELKMTQELKPDAPINNLLLSGIYYYLGDKKKGDYYKALAEKNGITIH